MILISNVLTTYRITKLSNEVIHISTIPTVLTTYRITKLSNPTAYNSDCQMF